jgi:two-component system cell cycle response regulator
MDRGRVLVVDDDRAWLALVAEWLRLEGHEILTATNGITALELASQHPPDLIVLDIVVPGINGLQFCEALKQYPRLAHVPVIILSGLRDPHNFKRAKELGVEQLLVKPTDEDTLRAAVRSALNRPRRKSFVASLFSGHAGAE